MSLRTSPIDPCLPPGRTIADWSDWLHEIKHDGFRIMARRGQQNRSENKSVHLWHDLGLPWLAIAALMERTFVCAVKRSWGSSRLPKKSPLGRDAAGPRDTFAPLHFDTQQVIEQWRPNAMNKLQLGSSAWRVTQAIAGERR